jgi:hypothetical protein
MTPACVHCCTEWTTPGRGGSTIPQIPSRIKFDSLNNFVGASCLVSIIGYLTAGIFNDHIVSVAPLFWMILGLGISINFKIKRDTAQIKD